MDLKWLPNALTGLRVVLAVIAAWSLAHAGLGHAAWLSAIAGGSTIASPLPAPAFADAYRLALAAFILGAFTDLIDGIAARGLDARSAFGAWLDPLADKLLVGLVLLSYGLFVYREPVTLIPAIAIIGRDLLVTALRARLGGGYALPVQPLAKWKTAAEMIAIAALLASPAIAFTLMEAGREGRLLTEVPVLLNALILLRLAGLLLLWLAALLSIWTAYSYWQAARHGPGPVERTFD